MVRLIFLFFVFGALCKGQNKEQNKERLFFIKETDTTLSVRNTDGEIILKPYVDFNEYINDREEILTDVILVKERYIDYKVYNREGKFLFTPKIFDFLVEYKEGHVGFTENGKEGLANKEGVKVIPAIYDYVDFLNNGLLSACNGCYFDRKVDPEHPPLVGGVWFLLDKKGKVLETKKYNEQFVNPNYQTFLYNKVEQKILKDFNQFKNKIVEKLNYRNDEVKFEIVYAPTKFDDFYHIKMYYLSGKDWVTGFDEDVYLNFQYSPKTKKFYGLYEESKIFKKNGEEIFEIKKIKEPLDKWLVNKKVSSS